MEKQKKYQCKCQCLSKCSSCFEKLWSQNINPPLQKIVKILENRSEVYFKSITCFKFQIVYIGPALPTFLLFILAMITSAILINGKAEFKTCEALNENDDHKERIDGYLLGKICILKEKRKSV